MESHASLGLVEIARVVFWRRKGLDILGSQLSISIVMSSGPINFTLIHILESSDANIDSNEDGGMTTLH